MRSWSLLGNALIVAIIALLSFVYWGGSSSSSSLPFSLSSSSLSFSLTSSIRAVLAFPRLLLLSFVPCCFLLLGQLRPMWPCFPHLKQRPSEKSFFLCSSLRRLPCDWLPVLATSMSMASGSFCLHCCCCLGFQACPRVSRTMLFLLPKAPSMAVLSSFKTTSSLAALIHGVSTCLFSGGALVRSLTASQRSSPCTNSVTVF